MCMIVHIFIHSHVQAQSHIHVGLIFRVLSEYIFVNSVLSDDKIVNCLWLSHQFLIIHCLSLTVLLLCICCLSPTHTFALDN